jgi:hypothetical protein
MTSGHSFHENLIEKRLSRESLLQARSVHRTLSVWEAGSSFVSVINDLAAEPLIVEDFD